MPEIKRRWTVEQRDRLPDDGRRYEVIDGDLFVTPAPAWRHQDAVFRLHAMLADYLGRNPIGYAFEAPADVVFSAERGVQPDVFVVPLVDGRRPEHFSEAGRLILAVEVLSASTARADRVAKRTLYSDEGVPEYWIVDLDARTFERTTPADSRVEIVANRLTWQPDGATEAFVLDVPEYFSGVLGGP